MLSLDRLRLAVMEEGVLSPVGGANGGLGHVVDDERERGELSHEVQLRGRGSTAGQSEATPHKAPPAAIPDLEGLCGGAAWLHPHRRHLRVHRSPGFRLHNSGVGRIDDHADDGCPELLGRVEDDECPGTKSSISTAEETESDRQRFSVSLALTLSEAAHMLTVVVSTVLQPVSDSSESFSERNAQQIALMLS